MSGVVPVPGMRVWRRNLALKVFFAIWVVLWLVFLVREDKDGQYAFIRKMYSTGPEGRRAYITGEDLYAAVNDSARRMGTGASYRLEGFGPFSIQEVRVRYILWPFVQDETAPDYIFVRGGTKSIPPGYEKAADYGDTGVLFKKGPGGI